MNQDIKNLLGSFGDTPKEELDFERLFNFNRLDVQFVPHSSISPNVYNPNIIADTERILLLQSLLEDGWTQPIVCRLPEEKDDLEALGNPDFIIVDGEQRWSTSSYPISAEHLKTAVSGILDRQKSGVQISQSVLDRLLFVQTKHAEATAAGKEFSLIDLSEGKVPITIVNLFDDAHAMLSTLRHNRARGTFDSKRLASTLQTLTKLGLGAQDFNLRLGMSSEESGNLLMAAAARTRSLEELSKSEDWNIDLGPLAEDSDILAYIEEATEVFDSLRRERRQYAKAEQYADENLARDMEKSALTSEERQQRFEQYRGEYLAENFVSVPIFAKQIGLTEYVTYDFYLTPSEYNFCMDVFACFKGSLIDKLTEVLRLSDEYLAKEAAEA